MTDTYFLAPSLVTFRNSINAAFPHRDKTSDGWIGDASHQARVSEHNPCWACTGYQHGIVRATDTDIDDNDPGRDLRKEILNSVIGHPAVWYAISNGIIYSRTHNWAALKYTGENGHFHHVHVSILKTEAAAKDLTLKLRASAPPKGGTPSTPARDTTISMWCIDRLAQKHMGVSGACLIDNQIVVNIAAFFDQSVVKTTRPYFWAMCAKGDWVEAGKAVAKCVSAIQVALKVTPDGVLGPKTAAALTARGYTVTKS
jgi:hypothetical protein